MSPTPDREILSVEEAAALLGVSVKTFNKVLHSEDLPARKIGREWKFSRAALIQWVGKAEGSISYEHPVSRKIGARDVIEVEVYVGDAYIDSVSLDRLLGALEIHLDACGYELVGQDEPVHSSFWQRFKFWAKKNITPEEASELLRAGQDALVEAARSYAVANTSGLARTAQDLVTATGPFDDVVLRVGQVLVVKRTVRGKSKVVATTITPFLARQLDERPRLMSDPQGLMDYLEQNEGDAITSARKGPARLEGGGELRSDVAAE